MQVVLPHSGHWFPQLSLYGTPSMFTSILLPSPSLAAPFKILVLRSANHGRGLRQRDNFDRGR
jgi:hypothetical protein